MSDQRWVFSAESKADAVRRCSEAGQPLTQVARELNIHPSLLQTWRQKTKPIVSKPKSQDISASLDEKVRRLRRENAELREDRDILKDGGRSSPGPCPGQWSRFCAVIVLTPANADQYGHEQLPGETEKHWLERTDPKLAAYVAHPPESRVHVTPVDDGPKSAIASRTPAQSAAAFPNHTGHSTASPQISTHTGHTSAAPPADSVSTTPITHTDAADHALFAKKSSSTPDRSAPGSLTIEAGAKLTIDESKVANELVAQGRHVTALAPSNVVKRADFLVDGKPTELRPFQALRRMSRRLR